MDARRVLIVDDDPDIVVYLTSYLEDNGYETRSAADGADALKVVTAFRPDVVLTDVLLPGLSGLDLLVTLRRDERTRDVPVVVMTGVDEILQHECHSYLANQPDVDGPDGVIGKPIDPEALLAVLGHLCSRPSAV